MSSASAAAAPMSTLDDDAWEDLLSFIEERRVIPIAGPELLLVSTERGPRLLLDWVAEKLAGRLNVNIAELPQPYTLNDLVCWLLSARGRREEAYVRMRSIIEEANFEPPAALHAQQVIVSTVSGVAHNDRNPSEALLQEAAALLDGLPTTLRALHDVRPWRERIPAAERGA